MDKCAAAATARLRDLVHGRWKAQAVAAAMRLGVPELLRNGPRSLPDLAQALGADQDAVGRFLHLLACLGVVGTLDNGCYALTDASRRLLDDHPETLARDARYTLSRVLCAAWDGVEQSIRTGTPALRTGEANLLAYCLSEYPAEATVVEAYQAGVARRNLAALTAATVRVPSSGTFVVLGLGNAPMLVGLLNQRSAGSGVLVVDVGQLDRGHCAIADVADRATVIERDIELPAGAAGYVLSHVLHDLPDDRASSLLRRIAASMSPESLLVIIAAAAEQAEDHLLVAYLDVQQFLLTGGRQRTTAEYEILLKGAGLQLTHSDDAVGRPGIRVLRARLREAVQLDSDRRAESAVRHDRGSSTS